MHFQFDWVDQDSSVEDELSESHLRGVLDKCWKKIAPFWTLKSLVAVNPMSGFQHLHFNKALRQAGYYFQAQNPPEPMRLINRISIKWLQAFFDEGQSVFQIPDRSRGLFRCIRELLLFDDELAMTDVGKRQWLMHLPVSPLAVINTCLKFLSVSSEDSQEFLLLILMALSGWSSHICYQSNWSSQFCPALKEEYLALRLVITCLVWPKAKELLVWHEENKNKQDASRKVSQFIRDIHEAESNFQAAFIDQLQQKGRVSQQLGREIPDAQWVFCIDVRSEPFRWALEAQGNHETFGFAGFFGLPIAIREGAKNQVSCPVLLQPEHHVCQQEVVLDRQKQKRRHAAQKLKKTYQSTKYSFTTPFALVEVVGLFFGLRMLGKSFFPKWVACCKRWLGLTKESLETIAVDLGDIPLEKQVAYAQSMLKTIGLTTHFSPLVVLTGHGSQTENNVYDSLLDCGACAGRSGGVNAKVQAAILNKKEVRSALYALGISIPAKTWFCAAEHNTTTDEVLLDKSSIPSHYQEKLLQLEQDLELARVQNNQWRSQQMRAVRHRQARKKLTELAQDWASVRPEWGLARNAGFIVAPRWLTAEMNLEGRSFLHSYDWQQDADAAILKAILTAPMIVGHWINSQYLFSAWDNTAFGGGNKITANIVGKMAVIQGNGSDLMSGLSLQSVYQNDTQPFHTPVRLTAVIYAPLERIRGVIEQEAILKELVTNKWVHVMIVDPNTLTVSILNPDLSAKRLDQLRRPV